MVGNSDGSVIETYSPDAGGSDGDNNKISISAKLPSGSMPLSSQWTALGVTISDMKYSSGQPQI